MINTKMKYDGSEDKLYVERVQDVEPILKANKEAFNNAGNRYKSECFNHVARVPMIVLEKWAKDKGISFHELMSNDSLMKRFLNDPENRYLRTRPGKI